MKLIEKTCPKCGANLEFNLGDKEVKCLYCNRQFIIEENNANSDISQSDNMDNNIKLVAKVGFGVHVFSIVMFFIIFLVVLTIIVFTMKSVFSNNIMSSFDKTVKLSSEHLSSIKDISDSDKQKLEAKSMAKINEWNHQSDNVTLILSKHLGYYLAYDSNFSTLYDVYELHYNISSVEHTIYIGVKYLNIGIKNNKLKISNGMIFGSILSFDSHNLWGYNSIQDLYNNIDLSFSSSIVASDGLYMDK